MTNLESMMDVEKLDGGLSELTDVLEPKQPNKSGATQCIVRWMVDTPAGWIGAWDREAFTAYVAASVQSEREECAALIERTDLSGAPDEMKGWLAKMIMAYADAIRARSNVEGNRPPREAVEKT